MRLWGEHETRGGSWLGGALLLALTCCGAYGARPESPAQGGRPWLEASSAHFRVLADLPADDARALAQELEENLTALEQVAVVDARMPVEQTTVIVFEHESDFHAFEPSLVEGRFKRSLPLDLEPGRYLLLHGALARRSRIACMHELTHDLFERNFGPAPPWLNEGWAQYYSTIEVEPDRVRIGRALPQVTFTDSAEPFTGLAADKTPVLAMPISLVPPPSELLRVTRSDFYEAALRDNPDEAARIRETGLYLGSWALVHMLHDGPEPYPTRYKTFLNEVQRDRVEPAWRRAFAGISDANFDRDFRSYLGKGELAMFEYGRSKGDSSPAITERTLSDAEVRVLWARLTPPTGANANAAQRDLDAAVREAPTSADARYFRGLFRLKQHRSAEAELDLTSAHELAPKDPRYLYGLLWLRTSRTPEAERLTPGAPIMQLALALAPVAHTAAQFHAVAIVLLAAGSPSEALPFAERAVKLAPIDAQVLDGKAQVLDALGRAAEAADTERAALAFLPDGENQPIVSEHLALYEARARKVP